MAEKLRGYIQPWNEDDTQWVDGEYLIAVSGGMLEVRIRESSLFTPKETDRFIRALQEAAKEARAQ